MNHKHAADYRTWDHVLVCYRAWKSSVNSQQFKASVLSDGSSPPGPPLWHAPTAATFAGIIKLLPSWLRFQVRLNTALANLCQRITERPMPLCSRWDLHLIRCQCQSVEMEMWYMFKPTMASDIWSVWFSLEITETSVLTHYRWFNCRTIILIPRLYSRYNCCTVWTTIPVFGIEFKK